MGNKNKTTNKLRSGEDNIRTKNKKNKAELTNCEIISHKPETFINIEVLQNEHQICTKKERKNKKLKLCDNDKVVKECHDVSEENIKNKDIDTKVKTNDKKKKRNFDEAAELTDNSKVKKNKSNKDHIQPNDKQINPKNKVDGASHESMVIINKRNFLNQDEAEVKDEDIDKFCDGLTEEDNETYENWVQLFEANFKKKKNSTS